MSNVKKSQMVKELAIKKGIPFVELKMSDTEGAATICRTAAGKVVAKSLAPKVVPKLFQKGKSKLVKEQAKKQGVSAIDLEAKKEEPTTFDWDKIIGEDRPVDSRAWLKLAGIIKARGLSIQDKDEVKKLAEEIIGIRAATKFMKHIDTTKEEPAPKVLPKYKVGDMVSVFKAGERVNTIIQKRVKVKGAYHYYPFDRRDSYYEEKCILPYLTDEEIAAESVEYLVITEEHSRIGCYARVQSVLGATALKQYLQSQHYASVRVYKNAEPVEIEIERVVKISGVAQG